MGYHERLLLLGDLAESLSSHSDAGVVGWAWCQLARLVEKRQDDARACLRERLGLWRHHIFDWGSDVTLARHVYVSKAVVCQVLFSGRHPYCHAVRATLKKTGC